MLKKVKSVVVGASIYEIVYTNENIIAHGDHCFGSQDFTKKIIKITTEKETSNQVKEEVTLHEIIHAIVDDRHLNMSEEQVGGISMGMYQVLRENKKLFKAFTFGT